MKTDGRGLRAAVVSVSGGGDAWPNYSCRNNCCDALTKHGFEVVYDKMMVMHSNWTLKTNDHLTMWLIRAIPNKVNGMLDEILAGKIRRTLYKRGLLINCLTNGEKREAYKFAKKLKIKNICKGCGWCADNCPVNNISIKDGRPVFANECIMCFRCVYGCPINAIESKSLTVFKDGFSLAATEKRMKEVELEPIEKCCKGLFFSGVKKYLLDENK